MRAFVIGNVALDETLTVDDMPAWGASIHGAATLADLGGKGTNQAVVLGRAGLDCRLVAAVGADGRADEIRSRLAAEPIRADLLTVPKVASDWSLILRSPSGENAIVTTNAAALAMPVATVMKALEDAAPGDLLLMQGNLSAEATRAALRAARAKGVRTALNPSPLQEYIPTLWPFVDMAFLNQTEAAALGGTEALVAAGVPQVVLTLGAKGAVLIDAGDVVTVPAVPCPVVDTTGAGDCFMATALASAALRDGPLDARAVRHAAAAAAITVSRPGTNGAFPTAAEMAAILTQP